MNLGEKINLVSRFYKNIYNIIRILKIEELNKINQELMNIIDIFEKALK